MIENRHTIFWIFIAFVTVLALYTLSSVLMPFVAGMIIAYLLDPLVDRIEKFGISRSISTVLVLTIFFVGSTGSSLLLLPVVLSQLSNLTIFLPTLITKLEPVIRQARSLFDNAIKADDSSQPSLPVADILSWAGEFLTEIISSSLAFANLLSLVIITILHSKSICLIISKTFNVPNEFDIKVPKGSSYETETIGWAAK